MPRDEFESSTYTFSVYRSNQLSYRGIDVYYISIGNRFITYTVLRFIHYRRHSPIHVQFGQISDKYIESDSLYLIRYIYI